MTGEVEFGLELTPETLRVSDESLRHFQRLEKQFSEFAKHAQRV